MSCSGTKSRCPERWTLLKAGLAAAEGEERSLNERIEAARKELAEVREKDSA